MAEEKKVERDSDTPVSEEMKEQQISGRQGLSGSKGQSKGQPPQGAGRMHSAGPPPEKSRFEEGRRPSEQGEGAESPESIKEREQGIGAKSGSRSADGERGATEATED